MQYSACVSHLQLLDQVFENIQFYTGFVLALKCRVLTSSLKMESEFINSKKNWKNFVSFVGILHKEEVKEDSNNTMSNKFLCTYLYMQAHVKRRPRHLL